MALSRTSWPWWRWVVTGLSVVGLTLSTYLGWHYLVGGSVIGCAVGSSCDEVLGSRWSTIGGILPVSSLAAGVYLAILLAGFYIGPATSAPIRRLAWRALLVLSGAAAGSAVWFIIVQKWYIGAFCPYCMATHLTGLVLAALLFCQAPEQVDGEANKAAPQRILGLWTALGMTTAGVALAGILAAGQVALAPATVYNSGETREVRLPVVDTHNAPLIGSPDAPFVVTLLFDYKCPHCQLVHSLLEETVRRYHGQLAFVLCPTPLNTRCNPYIPYDVEEFKDSCELAKIALTVWVAQRDAFPAFDQWMFSPESGERWHPRSVDDARAKAVELVGPAKFAAAQADPWVDRYLQTSIRIFGGTGGNAIPKLVFGQRWVNPDPTSADELVSILQSSLGGPKP